MTQRESSPPRPRLATQLEHWALVREKVLEKLDIRGARKARELATRIREVVLRMAEEPVEEKGTSLAELRLLCENAALLLKHDGIPKPASLPPAHDTRATLPAPRPPAHTRRPPRPSGVSPIKVNDKVKNHALRRRSAGG
jgi:hypothetical protein